MVGGQSKWKVELKADEWHNVAYEINFSSVSRNHLQGDLEHMLTLNTIP